jgi:AraC-like DNA-binding protein
MRIAGRGEIEVWEGASLWLLEAERESAGTGMHSHHAIQITLSLEGDFELRSGEERAIGPAVAVAADADHIFQATGRAAFLFVEPESVAGIAMARTLFRDNKLAVIPEDEMAHHIAALRLHAAGLAGDDSSLADHGRRMVAQLADSAAPPPLDDRVRAMIFYARANLEDNVSLSDAVAGIGLSPSRLRHLFADQTGLPFKTYVLWLRIQRAVELYARGESLTLAAHQAGFADSAHFSRTFRRTFGLPAAALRVGSAPTQGGAAEQRTRIRHSPGQGDRNDGL